LNSTSAEVRNNYGIALIGKGNIEEAMRQFSMAILIDPLYANVYINLGKVYLMQGDTKIACRYIGQAFVLNLGSQLFKEDNEQNCQ
jgi:Tfp pilus assembly protein PilF